MRIDVAREIAACVRKMGGVVLDDVLENPTFANADYWLPNASVVGELKCLSEDLAAKSQFNEFVGSLYDSWVRRGLVPRPTEARFKVSLRNLPARCVREFVDPIKRRLESSTVKKANRQLRETKAHLNAPDAKGLLMLANDGNYMLPPTMMAHLLSRMLKDQYTSINTVIYFSVNEERHVPGLLDPGLFWIDAIPPGRAPTTVEFRTALRSAWMAHHSTLVPYPILEVRGSNDPDFIDAIQFTKKASEPPRSVG